MTFYQFRVPTKIICDEGISQDFAGECELLSISKLFVVTDTMLVKLGLVEPILAHLKENGIEICGIFSDVPPDSSVKTVSTCAKLAKESGTQGFLAIGGGSVMDTAKGANILFSLGGDLKEDYVGAQTISKDLSPLIAIPTTAGTGSEVTEAIVIYDEESQTKLTLVDQHLLPSLCVLDPCLTTGLPAKLTAATGLDALTHAMEAIVSVQHGPVSDALALEAIRLIHQNLLTAVEDGNNIEARAAMLTAANLAGMAFNHSMVGVVHAVAHSIGALCHVHHGTANAIFLPYGLAYNQEEAQTEMIKIAPSLGLSSDASTQDIINIVHDLLKKINASCGMPICLKDSGVKEDQLEKIAELAEEDGASFYNPRPVSKEDILPFIKQAF
jgi:alcohol dehydrogenase class IV